MEDGGKIIDFPHIRHCKKSKDDDLITFTCPSCRNKIRFKIIGGFFDYIFVICNGCMKRYPLTYRGD